jgi:hypothetical protein
VFPNVVSLFVVAGLIRMEWFSSHSDLEEGREVRVFLLLVGLNRSLSQKSRSILRELIRPLERSTSASFAGRLFLIRPEGGYVENSRSDENGLIEESVPQRLSRLQTTTLQETELRRQVDVIGRYLVDIEDTWGDHGRSIINSLVFMQALSIAADSIPDDSDVVIFARPDVRIERGLRIVGKVNRCAQSRERKQPTSMFLSWHSFGGLNDRFVIAPREHIEQYFKRIRGVQELAASRLPYHSERYLLQSYKYTSFEKSIQTLMVRVRLGGVGESSDLELVRKNKWYRRRPRAIWKHKLSPALRNLLPLRSK